MKDNESEPAASGLTGFEIAVIGMSGRFPGASNIEEFWENLKNGRETIAFFSDEELKESGVPDRMLTNPQYMKAYGWLDEVLYFDASFFGYTPLEAEVMDPQIRLFHQCSYEALEDAGYDSFTCKKPIGIYAGASANFRWQANVQLSGKTRIFGWFAAKQLTDKDFLGTRLAYKLSLKGPAVTVDTACSTSLTAIHMAYQGLISGDCDMALAGGITVPLFTKSGYIYREGMINSSDGHCRAFDARADGSNFGNAAAIVVLKRYADAAADGDHIYAMIKGSAINNDGDRKAAFTAPSIDGQSGVIRTALNMAEVDPETITYVETHGTGTALGDPVEIEGLKAAFNTNKKHFCRIGSVKTNVGHLEMASGVAGFIKTVLALKYRQIPPSLFFEKPNPKIDLANSPFVVNTQLTEWKPNSPGQPLRAGVSSFGIGGTNTHVILEEAPIEQSAERKAQGELNQGRGGVSPPGQSRDREYQLILLSARTESSLEQMTLNLANHFEKKPGINLVDTAYTLQVGRRIFPHRRMVVCPTHDTREAADLLLSTEPGKVRTYKSQEDNPPIIFMFSGLGGQYVNMGRDLYKHEAIFRGEMDRCFEILKTLVDYDPMEILYPNLNNRFDRTNKTNNLDIHQPEISQVAVFIFEYALARLLMKWGIKPYALIGYSFGEYTAATLSGVFDISGALKLVVSRGQLLQQVPEGIMLSVPLTREEIRPYLTPGSELSLAIDNGPSCVIAGPPRAVGLLAQKMKEKKILCTPVPGQRAIHSSMMEPVMAEFTWLFHTVTLHKPQIPYISNVTGHWQTDKQASDPTYWARHLRETVQFAAGMKTLLKEPGAIFVEIGPGRDISTLALRYLEGDPRAEHRVLNLVRPPHQDISDIYFLLNRVGQLWLLGQPIDWSGFHGKQRSLRKRISLPTYPFEKQFYGVNETLDQKQEILAKFQEESRPIPGYADWFYIPTWTQHILLPPLTTFSTHNDDQPPLYHWLVFMDGCGLGQSVVKQLKQKNHGVITLEPGQEFVRTGPDSYIINPGREDDYHRLFKELGTRPTVPTRVLHLWGVTGADTGTGDMEEFEKIQETGFYSLLYTAKALGKENFKKQFQIDVVTDQFQEVTGEEPLCPAKAAIIGPVRVIPQEFPEIRCRSIDVILPHPGQPRGLKEKKLAEQLMEEILTETNEPVIAFRGNSRWVQTFQPLRLDKTRENRLKLRDNGVYLITGGMGNIGLMLAEYLARKVKAKLILTSRSPLPERKEWDQWLKNHGETDTISRKILQLQILETAGAEVRVFSVDTADKEKMHQVITRAEKELGPIRGIIHGAGIMKGKSLNTFQQLEKKDCQEQFLPKVKGLLILEELFRDKKTELDFYWLLSSISTVLGGLGLTAYAAANSFMDAYARQQERSHPGKWISVDWDGMDAEKTQLAFERILSLGKALHVVASNGGNLQDRIDQWVKQQPLEAEKKKFTPGVKIRKPRPALMNPYIPPQGDVQQVLVEIWQNLFGYDRLGIKDDFIELGGDSLKAIAMISQLHQELEVLVPLTHFFKKPDIESLAQWITITEKQAYRSILPVEQKEYYPLTSMQKRLYILHQMDPATVGYNLAATLLLEGETPWEKLQECFHGLIQRHESLRTSFHMINGESVQKIHARVEFEIEYYDMKEVEEEEEGTRGLAPLSNEPAAHNSQPAALISSFIRPFVLSRAPLLRVGLIKLLHTPTALRIHSRRGTNNSQEGKEDRYLLVADMHHIVHDGISQTILLEDFTALYTGKELSRLTIQYKDYAQWQNREAGSEAMKKQEIYWLTRFQGEIPVLNLPYDYPRPMMQNFAGAARAFKIEKEKTHSLRSLALAEEATLFMVILAIYIVFLAKLSTQEDIVVGTPEAGRKHLELQSVIGFFLHTLALRNYPAAGKPFIHFLREIKEQTLQAFENQDYPFEDLVERVSVKRDLSRSPLFDVMFILHTQWTYTPGESPEKNPGDLAIQSYDYEKNTSEFDLTLIGFDEGEHLLLKFEYCTRLFTPGTIGRFIAYFKTLLGNVLENPGCRIGEMGMIPEEEKHRLLYDFNDTALEFPGNKTIHQLFADRAEKTPDYIALLAVHEAHEKNYNMSYSSHSSHMSYMSYKELNEKSCQLACLLIEKGVKPGTIAAIMVNRTIHMMVGLLGILKAGAAYLPLDPGYPAERINYLLINSSAKMMVSDRKDLGTGLYPVPVIDLSYAFKSGTWGQRTEAGPGGTGFPGIHTAYVIYTSGSTGNPKGVVITHRNAVNFISGITQRIPFAPGKTILAVTTISFDIFFLETFLPLTRGLKVVIADERRLQDPALLGGLIGTHRVDMVQVTPSRLKLLLSTANQEKFLSGVETLIVGGEAFPPNVLEQVKTVFRGNIYNVYGPTETTIWSTVKDLTPGTHTQLTIGTPIANTQVYIVDRQRELQPLGIAGELLIRGDGVAAGYLNNIELTAEKFDYDLWDLQDYQDEDAPFRQPMQSCNHASRQRHSHSPITPLLHYPIYHTGDLARWLVNGEIEFLGRIDYQVKIRGFRIELEEIEERLVNYEYIEEAVVISGKNKDGDKYLAAYIVPRVREAREGNPSAALNVSVLREYLSGRLPEYMIPSYFVQLDHLPVTPNGKINRKALPEPTDYRPQLDILYLEPESETEKVMTRIWQEELGLEKIGVNDNFFNLGGNSMAVVRLVSRLNQEFNRNIPVVSIFKFRTIRTFSEYWTQKEDIELSIENRSEALKRGDQARRKRIEMIRGSMS